MRSNSIPEIKSQFSQLKSAFQPMNHTLNMTALQEQRKINGFEETKLIFSKPLTNLNTEKYSNQDAEVWNKVQIQKLFKLYNYYGPQWKIMSQHMPSRTANNLKNRFYTVLRNLIKLLFRRKAEMCPKLPGEIPSKDLSRLYDGKQDYKQFQSLISKILQELQFDLDSKNIENVVNRYSQQIVQVYKIIYGERVPVNEQESKERQNKFGQQYLMATSSSNFLTREKHMQKAPYQQPINMNQPLIKTIIPPQQPGYFCLFFFNPPQFYPNQSS